MEDKNLLETVKTKLHYGNDVSINRKAEKWVLEPLMPHKGITILDGLGGSGKSWFALDLSYSISLGQTFLGKFPVKRPGKVLYLTAEESPEAFVERLDMIQKHYPENKENFVWLSFLEEGIDMSSYLCTKKRGDRVITENARVLKEIINEIKPIVVVLDSLINFYGLDENSSEDAMFFYDVLKYLIREYDTNFLLLHHQNKEAMKTQADDVISFRGSGVLREQARSRIVYKNIKISERQIARKIKLEKSNYFSSLKDELTKGLYLKFEEGKHKYDQQFEITARRAEEEAKNKNKKKKDKKEIGDYDVDF